MSPSIFAAFGTESERIVKIAGVSGAESLLIPRPDSAPAAAVPSLGVRLTAVWPPFELTTVALGAAAAVPEPVEALSPEGLRDN